MRLLKNLCLLLCCVSGCRYYRWTEGQFQQVKRRNDCCEGSHPYIRSLDLYDGFSTVGHYDVLWYSIPVMRWHLERLAARTCTNDNEVYAQLVDELEQDQEQSIVFYLLMTDDTGDTMQPQLSVAKNSDALWSISLELKGTCYAPVEIKKLPQLSPELAACFGVDYIFMHSRYDYHYRFIYKIRFDRQDADGTDRFSDIDTLRLVLRSMVYEVPFSWCVAEDSIQACKKQTCAGVTCDTASEECNTGEANRCNPQGVCS